jgi:hypothetical protein
MEPPRTSPWNRAGEEPFAERRLSEPGGYGMKQFAGLVSAIALASTPASAQADETTAEDAAADVEAERSDSDEAAPSAAEVDPFEGIVPNSYVDEHVWVGNPVEIDGERVGEVSRIHFDERRLMSGLVVHDGDREVLIDILESHARSDSEDIMVFWLDLTPEQFDALPDFAEADVSAPESADDELEEEPEGEASAD